MRSVARAICVLALCGVAFLALDGLTGKARSEDRTLSFKQLHTGETVTITFKRNGRYDSEGLKKINYILRDWRRNESTTMDPALLDLVWEVYNKVGSRSPIYVLSGYRSPVTNAMLRSRSRGVAKYSQHMLGKAMDFYLPDVPLSRLRETALKFQRGGVGYYPTSGSPFVHMDTGSPRHWPRMTRQQLAKLFPDGKTVLIPSDGKPMPGYNEAVAELQRGARTQVASASGSTRRQYVTNLPHLDPSAPVPKAYVSGGSGKSGNLLAALFSSGEDGDEEAASGKNVETAPEASSDEEAPASAEPAAAKPTVVAALGSSGPTPIPRLKPLTGITAEAAAAVVALADAPIPTPKPILVAAAEPVAEAPLPAEKPLITASVTPQMASLAPASVRPLVNGSDAIGALIASGETTGSLTPAPLPAQGETMAATALAPAGQVSEMPPFATTFTGPELTVRDRPVLVAIDYRPEALLPYMSGTNCLRGDAFVSLRHPDQNDIGALTAISGPVVINQFATGAQLAYPMRRFTGPAVAPLATRTYQVASLDDDEVTDVIARREALRATTVH